MNAQRLGRGEVWAVQSNSRENIAYPCVRLDNGSFICGCSAGVRGHKCRHIEEVKQAGPPLSKINGATLVDVDTSLRVERIENEPNADGKEVELLTDILNGSGGESQVMQRYRRGNHQELIQIGKRHPDGQYLTEWWLVETEPVTV